MPVTRLVCVNDDDGAPLIVGLGVDEFVAVSALDGVKLKDGASDGVTDGLPCGESDVLSDHKSVIVSVPVDENELLLEREYWIVELKVSVCESVMKSEGECEFVRLLDFVADGDDVGDVLSEASLDGERVAVVLGEKEAVCDKPVTDLSGEPLVLRESDMDRSIVAEAVLEVDRALVLDPDKDSERYKVKEAVTEMDRDVPKVGDFDVDKERSTLRDDDIVTVVVLEPKGCEIDNVTVALGDVVRENEVA